MPTIPIRGSPGAKANEIVGRHGDAWKVRVTARPERGRANEALVLLLAYAVGVARRDVTIAAGEAARDKLIEISGSTRRRSRSASAERR